MLKLLYHVVSVSSSCIATVSASALRDIGHHQPRCRASLGAFVPVQVAQRVLTVHVEGLALVAEHGAELFALLPRQAQRVREVRELRAVPGAVVVHATHDCAVVPSIARMSALDRFLDGRGLDDPTSVTLCFSLSL